MNQTHLPRQPTSHHPDPCARETACRIGCLVPIQQPMIGPSFQQSVTRDYPLTGRLPRPTDTRRAAADVAPRPGSTARGSAGSVAAAKPAAGRDVSGALPWAWGSGPCQRPHETLEESKITAPSPSLQCLGSQTSRQDVQWDACTVYGCCQQACGWEHSSSLQM
jgi:hypothetical protein